MGMSRFELYLSTDGRLEYNLDWVPRLFGGTPSPALQPFGLSYLPNCGFTPNPGESSLLPYGEFMYTMEYLEPPEYLPYLLNSGIYYMRRLSYELRFFLVDRKKSYVERWYDYFETLLLTYGCITHRVGV